ncbi:MAG TPA: DUF4199 domain-containing protein [Bacteroidetes bacterium]|nr:DUF4199 domain-containing protein [Bacteroidota bacterium]
MKAKQIPFKSGITTGAAMVLYLSLFYYLDKTHLFNPLVFWSSLLFPMIGMVVAIRKVRRAQGDSITHKEALRASFLTWLLAMAIFLLFIYLLFNYIDNGLIDIQKDLMEKATGKPLKREDMAMTFGSVFFRWAIMLLPGFLLAYAAASFLKNK